MGFLPENDCLATISILRWKLFSYSYAIPILQDIFTHGYLGPTGITGGLALGNPVAAGSWFSLAETTQITAIGGHVSIADSAAAVASLATWILRALSKP